MPGAWQQKPSGEDGHHAHPVESKDRLYTERSSVSAAGYRAVAVRTDAQGLQHGSGVSPEPKVSEPKISESFKGKQKPLYIVTG